MSCWNAGRSVLNLKRWRLGDDSYGKDVDLYRVYQINHEVGHGLGHQHRSCPGKNERAPVMVQQTLSLGAASRGRTRPGTERARTRHAAGAG